MDHVDKVIDFSGAKPCPFCGYEKILSEKLWDRERYNAVCPNCGIHYGYDFRSLNEAQEAWNLRVDADKALREFSEFVAEEVCRDGFEAEAGAFAEIACRKLYNLGIVQKDGCLWAYEPREGTT